MTLIINEKCPIYLGTVNTQKRAYSEWTTANIDTWFLV